ncbi:hypothetical protein N7509_005077 [Penicillium cosmopolitanum]|uniref:Uncharacterized protein n=1 Tax=Penicillium cosmopolitanum TaxID=1131564 RepID=A0A9X0B9R6_9EURO|nr:uncharacterized protein N7509_005077 [Penicillium cosmopolitanum]KAJ5396964.1 hypothetical protein N7509_005077 [Penicillium cosmopolitanum]
MPFSYNEFKKSRKDWVKELQYFNKVWYRSRKGGRNHWKRKQDFLETLQSQLNQLLETNISELTTVKCFETKVREILEAIKIVNEDVVIRGEVLNMITMAISRLTFEDGFGVNDTFAMEWDKRVMKTDEEWRKNAPRDGDVQDFRREQLRSIWARLSVVFEDCNCLQCIKRRPSSNASSEVSKTRTALAFMRHHWQTLFSGI